MRIVCPFGHIEEGRSKRPDDEHPDLPCFNGDAPIGPIVLWLVERALDHSAE